MSNGNDVRYRPSLDSPVAGPYVPAAMTGPMPHVSVVLPIHNEQGNLAPLFQELAAALRGRTSEVIAVDDASSDGSVEELERLRLVFPGLRVLRLAAHSGQSAAVMAGCDAARADLVLTLDADGQNDPADFPRLLAALDADPGAAAAVGCRAGPRESAWRSLQSRVANSVRDWITGDVVRDSACGMRVMRRAIIGRLPRFDGMHRFFPTLIRNLGARVLEVPVAVRRRRYGASKYGMSTRAFRALRDAVGVRWLVRRSLRYGVREVGP